jgi:hypothetical protein
MGRPSPFARSSCWWKRAASALTALQSCTLTAARLLGREGALGEIRPQCAADLVAMPDDPDGIGEGAANRRYVARGRAVDPRHATRNRRSSMDSRVMQWLPTAKVAVEYSTRLQPREKALIVTDPTTRDYPASRDLADAVYWPHATSAPT